MPLRWHEPCLHTNKGAQKGAAAAQRRGIKGAAALPLRDSGANPIRAQTGAGHKRGGGGGVGLACNKGAGGSHTFPRSAKGAKGRAPFMRKRVGRTRPV
jgi:hypothetical protein